MTRPTWRNFRKVLEKVHNLHVFRAIREANKGIDDPRLIANTKRNLMLRKCIIAPNDTAQIILLKELLFWVDLGYLQKNNQASVSLPESWTAVRNTTIPQLVITYKKLQKSKNRAFPQLTIPHYKGTKKPQGITYTKGNKTATLRLKDGSRLVVNAISETEAEKVINHYKKYIDPKFLTNIIHVTERKGKRIDVVKHEPIRADYYPKGQDVPYPEWRHYFQ